MGAFAVSAEQAEDLKRFVAGGPEPVRESGVEVSCMAALARNVPDHRLARVAARCRSGPMGGELDERFQLSFVDMAAVFEASPN
ncbi:MAG: hypothetical protein ACR2GT_04480 [Gaiellaceae bacterium]